MTRDEHWWAVTIPTEGMMRPFKSLGDAHAYAELYDGAVVHKVTGPVIELSSEEERIDWFNAIAVMETA